MILRMCYKLEDFCTIKVAGLKLPRRAMLKALRYGLRTYNS
jgi:hypothetical protein